MPNQFDPNHWAFFYPMMTLGIVSVISTAVFGFRLCRGLAHKVFWNPNLSLPPIIKPEPAWSATPAPFAADRAVEWWVVDIPYLEEVANEHSRARAPDP